MMSMVKVSRIGSLVSCIFPVGALVHVPSRQVGYVYRVKSYDPLTDTYVLSRGLGRYYNEWTFSARIVDLFVPSF